MGFLASCGSSAFNYCFQQVLTSFLRFNKAKKIIKTDAKHSSMKINLIAEHFKLSLIKQDDWGQFVWSYCMLYVILHSSQLSFKWPFNPIK